MYTITSINIEALTRLYIGVLWLSVPQIKYPLGDSSKKGSNVYFLLIVAMVLLLWCQIVLLWHQVTMVASEQHWYQTIVLPRKLATGSIHDYLFRYCPLLGILFEVLRIAKVLGWCCGRPLIQTYLGFHWNIGVFVVRLYLVSLAW